MRRDDERPLLAKQPLEQFAELLAPFGIERGGGLVHQQQRRIDRQRAGDRHALCFAARELAGVGVRPMGYAKRREELPSTPLRVGRGDAVRVHRRQADIAERGEVFEQTMELEHHADLAAQLPQRRRRDRSAAGQRDAVDEDRSGVERFEPRHRAKNGGFSRP